MNVLRAGHAVALCVIALLTLGIVLVISASQTIDAERAVTLEGILTSRTSLYALLACGMLLIGSRLDLSRLPVVRGVWGNRRGFLRAVFSVRFLPVWLFVVSIVLLALVYTSQFGREVNGAHRWIRVGPSHWNLTFQPSEFAKWAMILVVSWYVCVIGADRMKGLFRGLLPALFGLMLICGLVAVEDLGTGVLIGVVGVVLLFAAGARIWHLVLMLLPAVGGVYWLIVSSDYRMDRIRAFRNPYADPEGAGYHIIQSMSAIADGRLTGRGLGHGVHKFGYLPEDTTDFLFAIVCEELGIVGVAVVVFLYLVLIFAGLSIVGRLGNQLARLAALGVVLTVGVQVVMNLAVVTGLAPTKGIALPLLSSGGTGWLLTAFSLGLLIAMDRSSYVAAETGFESSLEIEDDPDSLSLRSGAGWSGVGAISQG